MPPNLTKTQPFRCEVQAEREGVRIRPVGEVDLATVDVVQAQLAELKAVGFSQLTLDLRAVSFMDSTGLRMILEWDASSRADGFAFSLVAGSPAVQRLFDVTGTRERLDFVDAACMSQRGNQALL
jgi:anti-sigma B factor antagonist